MTQRALDAALDALGWLDSAAESLQTNVKRAFDALGPSRRGVKNFLHGTWLGHPLHPVLTDIPLGAWTMTMVLDAIEARGARDGLARAADVSLGVGLAGAVAAAATGLTDWSDTYARPRKVGLAHAGLNAGATVLFAASYLLRVSGNRAAGRVLAATGYRAAVAGAYLGGELIYQEHIGVNHSSGGKLPEDFYSDHCRVRAVRRHVEACHLQRHPTLAGQARRKHSCHGRDMRTPGRPTRRGKAGRRHGRLPVARLEVRSLVRCRRGGAIRVSTALFRSPHA